MKKVKQDNIKIAVWRADTFAIRSKSPLANGKLLDCKVTSKVWAEAYIRWWDDRSNKEMQMQAVLALVEKNKDDKEVVEAYRKEYLTLIDSMPQQPSAPKMIIIRMKVVSYGRENDTYLVEPSRESGIKELTKLGY